MTKTKPGPEIPFVLKIFVGIVAFVVVFVLGCLFIMQFNNNDNISNNKTEAQNIETQNTGEQEKHPDLPDNYFYIAELKDSGKTFYHDGDYYPVYSVVVRVVNNSIPCTVDAMSMPYSGIKIDYDIFGDEEEQNFGTGIRIVGISDNKSIQPDQLVLHPLKEKVYFNSGDKIPIAESRVDNKTYTAYFIAHQVGASFPHRTGGSEKNSFSGGSSLMNSRIVTRYSSSSGG